MSQHVDGEIRIPAENVFGPRVPVEPTDLDYRTVALNAAVNLAGGRANRSWVVDVAKDFENYLRTGEAA